MEKANPLSCEKSVYSNMSLYVAAIALLIAVLTALFFYREFKKLGKKINTIEQVNHQITALDHKVNNIISSPPPPQKLDEMFSDCSDSEPEFFSKPSTELFPKELHEELPTEVPKEPIEELPEEPIEELPVESPVESPSVEEVVE